MKIGILTYHAASNFGAQLQALSTVCYLKQKGHTPIVINWYPQDLEKLYTSIVPVEQLKIHSEFVNTKLHVTNLCRNEQDIIKTIDSEGLDGLIIGSDAVLNYQDIIARTHINKKGIKINRKFTTTMYPNAFWAHFTNQLKDKIPTAMMSASSQGTAFRRITGQTKARMSTNLKNFRYISVRDSWTKNMVSYITDGKVKPEVTPDPVFGFNSNVTEYLQSREAILKKFDLPDKYIILSFYKGLLGVSTKWVSGFEDKAKQNGYTTIALPFPSGVGFANNLTKKINLPLDPLDWYELIRHSNGYIGHKMHPIVIALHNATPFFSFDNYESLKFKVIHNPHSSKIHHILNEGGFANNRWPSVGKLSYREPSIGMVLDHILNFDRQSCRSFSKRYSKQYFKMMAGIERCFKQI